MATIHAEGVEINAEAGYFQLLPEYGERLTRYALFSVMRGAGIMEYAPDFGVAHHLPGSLLSVEYVQAAVIGHDQQTNRWLLGLHLQTRQDTKPHWVELVRWPPGATETQAREAQHAGRCLAEALGTPLKVFGVKKLPRTGPIVDGRSGITGPVEPHKREDLTPERVHVYALSARLPAQYPGMWLGSSKDGVTLRLAKEAVKRKGSLSPSFNQCIVNSATGTVSLLPPTGMLGSFFGGASSRSISRQDVRNLELRLTISRESVGARDEGDVVTELSNTRYDWSVHLTIKDESLLLAQTSHTTSGELLRQRTMAGDKFAVDSRSTMEYLRQHQEDQEAYEAAETFAHTVAVVLANALNARVVKTEVDLGAY